MKNIIGENIARYRKEKGLTQEEVAKQLNITCQAVSKWENGYSSPDVTKSIRTYASNKTFKID